MQLGAVGLGDTAATPPLFLPSAAAILSLIYMRGPLLRCVRAHDCGLVIAFRHPPCCSCNDGSTTGGFCATYDFWGDQLPWLQAAYPCRWDDEELCSRNCLLCAARVHCASWLLCLESHACH